MEFPNLDGDPLIDDIINKCWHNNYATIAELAAYTETLLPGRENRRETNAETIKATKIEVVNGGESRTAEDFSSKKAFCQSLERRGLLHILSSGEPGQLGFTIEWYRHSKS
jgi:hypothetical protein